MRKMNTQKGFTLLELIVYIGIASMVLIMALGTGINLIKSKTHIQSKQEVYSNARNIMYEFQLQIHNAEDMNIGASTLTLNLPGDGTDVIFDTYTKEVTVGGQSVTINKLRMKEGNSEYVDLTTDDVDVVNILFEDRTRSAENQNVKIELTLENVNPGNDPNYDANISLETAVSVRE